MINRHCFRIDIRNIRDKERIYEKKIDIKIK